MILAIPELTSDILTRFWSQVDCSGDCWIWQGGKDKDGYGLFWIGGGRNNGGKSYRANRIAYASANGNPGRLLVCHSCDNPQCCNPSHLWAGTAKQNTEDMVTKGRGAKGEKSTQTSLTSEQVTFIRESVESNKVTGKKLGISAACVSSIRRRKNWAHLPETKKEVDASGARLMFSDAGHPQGSHHPGAKLTEDQVLEIRRDTVSSFTAIAKKYNVSRSTVSLIHKRKIWAHV